jgi:hypothetical protein
MSPVERAGVLEEELALLRIIEAELRQVDLLLVGLRLPKSGFAVTSASATA